MARRSQEPPGVARSGRERLGVARSGHERLGAAGRGQKRLGAATLRSGQELPRVDWSSERRQERLGVAKCGQEGPEWPRAARSS